MVRLRRGAASADSLRVQLACQPKLPEESSRPDGSEGWRAQRDDVLNPEADPNGAVGRVQRLVNSLRVFRDKVESGLQPSAGPELTEQGARRGNARPILAINTQAGSNWTPAIGMGASGRRAKPHGQR
jgi:hypothetical protein